MSLSLLQYVLHYLVCFHTGNEIWSTSGEQHAQRFLISIHNVICDGGGAELEIDFVSL